MSQLANFPMLSQRDGDINATDDCVPASIAACLEWLTGRQYSAREVKDAVYGPAYTGGTAAFEYVSYCREQGVNLEPISGNGAELVADLHKIVASNRPALITEPDPYEAGWSHVCAAYREDDGSITVMDPWIDQPVTKVDSTWASQLEDNQIWLMELIERTTWLSEGQKQQAEAYWNSTTAGSAIGGNAPALAGIFAAGKAPPYDTGIAQAWQSEYMNGRVWGPPISYEFQTVDWNGEKIVAQMFPGGRCEWKNNTAHWYPWQ
jgi:hypothetical protein